MQTEVELMTSNKVLCCKHVLYVSYRSGYQHGISVTPAVLLCPLMYVAEDRFELTFPYGLTCQPFYA